MSFRDSMLNFMREITASKTVHHIIARELKEAHIKKLEAESAVEYAMSIVDYNAKRIKRLEAHLEKHTKEGDYV